MPASTKHLRTRGLGLLIAALAGIPIAAACDDPTIALPREGAPERLEFAVRALEGGFSREVELRRDTVVLRRASLSGGPAATADSVRVVPTADQWRAFWAVVEETGVARWRRRYLAEGVMDGAIWKLQLRSAGGSVVSEGTSAYPDRLGREHEVQSTPEFDAFQDALGILVGQPIW